MKYSLPKQSQLLIAVALSCWLLSGCTASRLLVPPNTIPAGRAPSAEDEQYGHSILTQLQERYTLDYNNPAVDKVTEIVDRITKAAGTDKHPWHVYLFRDPKVKNAAATRGNHVFVWSGMLSAARSDGELAAILAHEIAHVISGHTDPDPNEELKKILVTVGAVAAGAAVSIVTRDPYLGSNLGDLTSSATGEVASGLLLNPQSRETELEADRIGLLLMAQAKYDPNEALAFWTRAQGDPDFSAGIPFFSSHPPAQERLDNLREALPFALARYKGEYAAPASSVPAIRNTAVDSFDLNTVSTSAVVSSSADLVTKTARVQTPAESSWRVMAARAVLYREASSKSARVGEFSRDAVVAAVGETEGWVEIVSPDHGYLRKGDLERVLGVRY